MPSIADQVATIEHDLAAALAEIDALTAANKAFDSANASLQRDNIALQLELNDMKHYVDDTRAMVGNLSQSALELLRASRRQVGQPADVVPLSIVQKQARINAAHEALQAAELAPVVSLDAKIAILPEKWPEQKAVAEIMAADIAASDASVLDRDSGDEHHPWHPAEDDQDHHLTAAEIATLEEQDAGNANALASDTTPVVPPPNKFEPMPIFLQRDTAFESANVRPIFG